MTRLSPKGTLYEDGRQLGNRQENRNLSKVLISSHGNRDLLKRIILYYKDHITSLWNTDEGQDAQYQIVSLYNFVSSGSATIIEEWIDNEFQQSPEEIAQFIDKALLVMYREFLQQDKLPVT